MYDIITDDEISLKTTKIIQQNNWFCVQLPNSFENLSNMSVFINH
jgi:hypothetical protein